MTEELISFASKQDMLVKSKQFWNPDKTQFWIDSGVPLVIDRREGYFIYDVEGKRLIDVHLNGGTYNLGHRNPEVAAAVTAAMQRFDIDNHHFPSLARTALAEALVSSAPPGLTKVMYGSGGGEAIDIALKTARHATKKRGIVSVAKACHGHTGLAVATGDERFATLFLADRPDEFTHVPFNDQLRAMIREVIRDLLPNGLPVTETVNLFTDEDLAAFVERLLDLDPDQREEIRSGRKRFRLPGMSSAAPAAPVAAASVNGAERAGDSPVRRIERGAVTEAVVSQAVRAGERLVLGRAAVLTPLARDRARASGMPIEKER